MLINRLIAVVALVSAVFCANDSYCDNYAVFVGVNRYENSVGGDCKLDDLKCCVGDMVALKDALVKAGFVPEKNVLILTSETKPAPTKTNVLAAVDDLLRRIGPDDTVFFAFAGHGLSLSEDGRSGDVLCCSDAKIVRFGHCEGVIYRSELERMFSADPSNLAKITPKVKIFMFDACRNIPNAENHPGGRSIRGFGNPIGSHGQVNYPNTIRMASCSPGQISHENKFGINRGLFTHFLITGLEGEANKTANGGDGNSVITLHELFEYARKETTKLAKGQTPTKSENELRFPTTEFVLGKCAAEKTVASPIPTPTKAPYTSSRNATYSGGNRGVGGSSITRSGSGR